MKKRLLSILLVLLTALTLLPLGALADDNNKCGENLTWKFADGILTISGTGEMYDYSSADPAPWSAKNSDICEITVGDGVTSIGDNAFHSCKELSMVTFMGGLTRIGSGAFAGCEALRDFDFPYSLETIGANAFSNCNNLIDVTIPDSVQSIGSQAFSCCEGLQSVYLPQMLTIIPDGIFTDCARLGSVYIPDTVTEIGANAFSKCTEFSLTGLPAGIKSIGDAAFANCGRIEELVLPETLEHIGEAAFNGTAIDKASFAGTPERWTAIGGNACCIAQDKIDFLEHTCDFGGSWQYDTQKHWKQCSCNKTQNEGAHTGTGKTCDVCGAVLSAALGSGSIDGGLSWSLSRSGALTISGSGKMPDFSSVANAAPWDKQKDKIQSVVIESGVQSISGGAFSGCTALEKVSISDTVAQIDLNAFGGCTSLAAFEVAEGNKAFLSVGGVLFSADKELLRCPVGKSADYTVPSGTVAIAGGVCSVCGAKGAEAAPEFDDVKSGAFYFDAVQWAVENGITNGTGKNTFSPNNVCSRYQIVMFLWRAAGQPEAKAAVSFADVKPGDIFYEAVQWAVERGITKGTSSTSFSPYAPCTRGQIVTFLYRSAGSPKVSGACNFSDVSSGSFCHDAVIWASSEGITNGTSAGLFSPNEGCTRAQVVTFLYRASGGK